MTMVLAPHRGAKIPRQRRTTPTVSVSRQRQPRLIARRGLDTQTT